MLSIIQCWDVSQSFKMYDVLNLNNRRVIVSITGDWKSHYSQIKFANF